MSATSLFLVSYLPAPVTAMHFQPFVSKAYSVPYLHCLFRLLKDIVLATVCYKHTFPLRRNKVSLKKTHTIEQQTPFLFCLVWLLELTFFCDKSCQNRQISVCKGDNPNIKYETFEPMCI